MRKTMAVSSTTMRDSIVFDSIINGENYSVFFMAGRGGRGVDVTLTKRRSASELVSEHADVGRQSWRAEGRIREVANAFQKA